jgi:hypothetical protein
MFQFGMSTSCWVIVAFILTAPAAAQEFPSDSAGPEPTLRADSTLCTEALELSCRTVRKPPEPQAPMNGLITKFSHLAGMFMGRVDAAQSRDFHFRFTLDLKTPPSSTDNHINLDNRAG